ncbi:kinase-like domain-containing protein [Cladorrhinum sp. PSN259]|nr:kinase-like domain-containing protein [Cladorrhinum sp. PSN259]
MAPLTQAEEASISASILQELSETPYACSSLTQLTGGTANFVYRGNLARPFPANDGLTIAKTVIIKHSTAFAAINPDFPLDITRCTIEQSILEAVARYSPPFSSTVKIKTPNLYLFSPQTNTQVIQDFPETTDLKSVLFSRNISQLLPPPSAEVLGRHLGSWLRSFHTWASSSLAKSTMRATIGRTDRPMRQLKRSITYDSILTVLENYPELLVGHEGTLTEIRDVMGREFGRPPRCGEDEEDIEWGIIHGDFWSGNVLLPDHNNTLRDEEGNNNRLFVIDWEFAQYGHRAYDLGQMIGDLYEREVFNGNDTAMHVMRGVIEGYGEMSDEMAFRVAIHAGVHLVGWYNRRPRSGALVAPREVIVAGLMIGRDLILKGWARDRESFEDSVLAGLFAAK